MDWGHTFYLIFWSGIDIISFLIRICSLVMVPRRQNSSTATAWLLIILLWPWPGIIAYSILGTNLLPKRRVQLHNKAVKHFQELRATQYEDSFSDVLADEQSPQLRATAQLATNLGYLHAVQGNKVEYLTDAFQFIQALVDEIDSAKNEVNLLYYIFADDVLGKKVADACIRAAKRGLTVRMLVDSVGSIGLLRSPRLKELRSAGVKVVEALPVRIYRAKAQRFDLRNHRKLAIIDRKCAITGSHNVTEPSYGRADKLMWVDVSLKLHGPVVSGLESVFVEDWYVETGEMLDMPNAFEKKILDSPPKFPGNATLQTVPSGPSYPTENYQRLIIASIIGAKRQVTITTPYLIPDEGMLQAIEVARLRGVSVRLVTPKKSDQIIAGYASRAYYEDFLKRGVELYLYEKGLLHAKTVTIDDDLGFVGSSNFDIRSFSLNFEINLILYGIEENTGIHSIQEAYIRDSHQLTETEWEKRGHISLVLESATKLLSPLL